MYIYIYIDILDFFVCLFILSLTNCVWGHSLALYMHHYMLYMSAVLNVWHVSFSCMPFFLNVYIFFTYMSYIWRRPVCYCYGEQSHVDGVYLARVGITSDKAMMLASDPKQEIWIHIYKYLYTHIRLNILL